MLQKRNDLFTEILENFFNSPFHQNEWRYDGNKQLVKRDISENLPSANVIETKGDFQYELATPGFDKHDISIGLENNVLTIKGEKIIEENKKEKDYLSKEFHFQKFKRSFDVPENVVLDEIYAKIDNGITTLFLPKEKIGKKESLKRSIDIV